MLSEGEWKRLRTPAYQRAGWRCVICGGKGPTYPVVCHEVWEYDDAAHVQRLVGLMAICPACNGVKHFGLSISKGKKDEAFAHLLAVNGWSEQLGNKYMALVSKIWSLRSEALWSQDLSWLGSQGVAVPSAESEPTAASEVAYDVSFQIEDPCSWWDDHDPANPADRKAAMAHFAECPQCRRGISKDSFTVDRSLEQEGPGVWKLRPGDHVPVKGK